MPDTFRQVGADTATGWKRDLSFAQKVNGTYKQEGERSALLGLIPSRGHSMETVLGVELFVTSAKLVDLDGGAAQLSVECEAFSSESSTSTAPLGVPQYETEWTELRKKLETHPCCGVINPESLLTWENWVEMKTPADYVLRTDTTHGGPNDIPSAYSSIGAWNLDNYRELKANGVEEYPIYYPIVTRTLSYLARPSGVGSASGKIQNPPFGSFDYISDYKWLAGPDRCVRKGDKYERTQRWVGCDKFVTKSGVPSLLYVSGGST